MVCCSAYSRQLDKQGALRQLPHPWRSSSVGRPKPKISAGGIVSVAFVMPPILFRIVKARASLKQQHVEPAGRELLRDDCSAASSSYDNDITHIVSPSSHVAAILEITEELAPAVGHALVTRKIPRDRVSCQRAC